MAHFRREPLPSLYCYQIITPELVESLLSLLKPGRFLEDDRNLLGSILVNYFGEAKGTSLWRHHTRRVQGLLDSSEDLLCVVPSPPPSVSLRTLAWWAQEDSPDSYYQEWLGAWGESTHISLENSFYRIYWLDYSFEATERRWFRFDRVGTSGWWEVGEENLLETLRGDFSKRFEKERYLMCQSIFEDTHEESRDEVEDRIKELGENIRTIQNSRSRQGLVRKLEKILADPWLTKALREGNNLQGVANGVLERKDSSLTFRRGRVEDFAFYPIPVIYSPHYSWEHQGVRDLMTWLGGLGTKEVIENLLKFLSMVLFTPAGKVEISTLRCMITDKIVTSHLITLLKETFGPYLETDLTKEKPRTRLILLKEEIKDSSLLHSSVLILGSSFSKEPGFISLNDTSQLTLDPSSIKYLARALLWILVEKFQQDPLNLTRFTQECIFSNTVYEMGEVYNLFEEWWKKRSTRVPPSRTEICLALNDLWGPPCGGCWANIRCK